MVLVDASRRLSHVYLLSTRNVVTPRSRGYGDATVTYICRAKILSHIYAKPQYREYISDP